MTQAATQQEENVMPLKTDNPLARQGIHRLTKMVGGSKEDKVYAK